MILCIQFVPVFYFKYLIIKLMFVLFQHGPSYQFYLYLYNFEVIRHLKLFIDTETDCLVFGLWQLMRNSGPRIKKRLPIPDLPYIKKYLS